MARRIVSPPPEDGWRDELRRWMRSLSSLSKTQYWLLTRGLWFVVCFAIVYIVDGALIGWSRAYEVMIGITSPAEAPYPAVNWVMSLIGWMIIPAFIGGTTGYLVGHQIDSRRSKDADAVHAGLEERAARNNVRSPGEHP